MQQVREGSGARRVQRVELVELFSSLLVKENKKNLVAVEKHILAVQKILLN